MNRFEIAGLTVDMDPHMSMLKNRARHYANHKAGEADITIPYREEWYREKSKLHPTLTFEENEYVWSGEEFYLKLLLFRGFMLHASAVVYDGNAYLFSAPSGTGKSTHTSLWLQRYPGSYILNDDKPAIRLLDRKFYACGTPWSGKNDISRNELVPVAGLAFIERDEANRITTMSSHTALFKLLSQTVRPYDPRFMDKLLDLLDVFLTEVPIYYLGCNITMEAPETAYNAMKKR